MMKFPRLTEYIEKLHCEKNAVSCGMIIYKDHEKIYEHFCGFRDAACTEKANGKTLYNMYSCTKPMTVAAGMMLCERGVISLDDPVAKYLPEIRDAFVIENGEKICVGEKMLVRHLFTMSAGFDYGITSRPVTELVKKTGGTATTREIVRTFISLPLCSRPGEIFRYSLCHDVLAAVIEAASGKRFADFMRESIFEPLGMENTYFHLPMAEKEKRMAELYKWDAGKMRLFGKSNAYELTANYDSGGAGLISCAEDYAVFADAMACGGVAKNGVRLLSEESVRYMASDRLSGFISQPESFNSVVGKGYGYGLGLRVLTDKAYGAKAPLGEFGWDGAAGSCFTADPENGIGMIFTEHLFCWPDAQGGKVHVEMRNAFYEDFYR